MSKRSLRRVTVCALWGVTLVLLGCGDRGRREQRSNQESAGQPASDTMRPSAGREKAAAAPAADTAAARQQPETTAAPDTFAATRRAEIQRAPRGQLGSDTTRPRRLTPPPVRQDTGRTARQDTGATVRKSAAAAPDTSGQVHDIYHPAPLDTVSQVVYDGWKYFNLNCARCHGEDVMGTTIAPHLIESFRSGKVDQAEFDRVVHGSRQEKGMPNWTGIIPDDKLNAIYEYVKARSEGKLHPGRPALKSGA